MCQKVEFLRTALNEHKFKKTLNFKYRMHSKSKNAAEHIFHTAQIGMVEIKYF